MLLAIDIGNTNISIGVFENKSLIKNFRVNSDVNLAEEFYKTKLQELLSDFKITSCVIASVVEELTPKIKKVIDKLFEVNSLVINQNLDLGINLKVTEPHKVGADRIVNACFAAKHYPKPTIIVDIGSAITFDIVDKSGDFIGGVIMAGLKMQLNALYHKTSKLPEIEIKSVKKAIGNNTKNAILSGVVRGTACAIEGLISQCEKELGEKAYIVATGGDAKLVAEYLERQFDETNPILTLKGLCFLKEKLK